MYEEIIKRPFVRPLFLWIVGILLYTYLSGLSLILLVGGVTLVLLLLMSASSLLSDDKPCYEWRWVWGATFSFLILLLSITICRYESIAVPDSDGVISLLEKYASLAQGALVDRIGGLDLTDDEKSILATLTLGYKKAMTIDMKETFSLAGVSHILAVSGFHVAVVCGMISFICSLLPRGVVWSVVRYMIQVVALWSFVFMTGLAPSAIRAATMLTIYIVGRAIRRRTDGYNTLAASAFCMLAYNPGYLFDVGFQLSYLAVLGILYVMPRLREWIDVRNPLLAMPMSWIMVSVSAQVGTSLLCFYYFGRFSLVFLFTNPPVSLLATLLIPLSLVWLLYPSDWLGYGLLKDSVELLLGWLVDVVELFASMPFATVEFDLF